ncbi:MAG: hypothetical protein FJ146_11580 [Deltaproteobacteria bacterium]|nr:hypothetical protein [Deltaproteobacteria bacterium]
MRIDTRKPRQAEASTFLELPQALSQPGILSARHACTEVRETHLSYLFFTEHEVYKLKKSVRRPFVDLSSVAARLHNAQLEILLNRRLAPQLYLGLSQVTHRSDRVIALDGQGETIDWLVRMHRLPADRMLDCLIDSHAVANDDLACLTTTLDSFYAGAKRISVSPTDYLASWHRRLHEERSLLLRPELALPEQLITVLTHELETMLLTDENLFSVRVHGGHIVDGHGDLRPEHICLTDTCTIFDCLEFSASLRTLDTADELAYLAMELRVLGADDLAAAVVATCHALGGDVVPPLVHSFYTCYRALLRARLCVWHLYDCSTTEEEKWRRKTHAYLSLASEELGKNR